MKVKEMNPYKIITMKSLINSTKKILEDEGLNGITIRKVGHEAGYNSATMYNYFENLEHLKIFACMSYFDEYIDDLKNYVSNEMSLIERYYSIWRCFTKHTVENLEVFYHVFFNSLSRKTNEYVDEYYKIFPLVNRGYGQAIDEMLSNHSIYDRNKILLNEIADAGYIHESDIAWINDLSNYTYESVLFRMYKGIMSTEEGENEIERYVRMILEKNLIER